MGEGSFWSTCEEILSRKIKNKSHMCMLLLCPQSGKRVQQQHYMGVFLFEERPTETKDIIVIFYNIFYSYRVKEALLQDLLASQQIPGRG